MTTVIAVIAAQLLNQLENGLRENTHLENHRSLKPSIYMAKDEEGAIGGTRILSEQEHRWGNK
jgi:hypothetical protein